jgi:hypothetical protein
MPVTSIVRAVLFLIFATPPLFAQSLETPVYVEQFSNLQSSMDRIYSECSRPSLSAGEKESLTARLFALQKTAHRLEEQAGKADLESVKQGRTTDKQLRLVEQGAMSIDVVLAALGNYLDTDDRVFLNVAIDVKKTVEFIRKMIL